MKTKFRAYTTNLIILLASFLSCIQIYYTLKSRSVLFFTSTSTTITTNRTGGDADDDATDGTSSNRRDSVGGAETRKYIQDDAKENKVQSTVTDTYGQQDDKCQRKCPHKNNTIIFTDKATGLGDRKGVLRGLAQLSAYLCAKLVVPPPSELLTINHNFGKPISKDMKWSDIFNVTYIQDGSMALLDHRSKNEGDEEKDPKQTHQSIPKDWVHVISTNGTLRDNFMTVQNLSFQQSLKVNATTIGFVWEIHEKWYGSDLWLSDRLPPLDPAIAAMSDYRDEMRPYMSTLRTKHPELKTNNGGVKEGCMYIDKDATSSYLKEMQTRLVDQIKASVPKDSILGGLHLRRGDAIGKCDTEVETMRMYLSCSLNHTESLNRHIALLLMTDETDAEYRTRILSLAKDYNHVSILDIDQMTVELVKNAIHNGSLHKGLDNNYFHYEVSSIVRKSRSITDFYLLRRRSHCKDCIPLAKYIRKALVSSG